MTPTGPSFLLILTTVLMTTGLLMAEDFLCSISEHAPIRSRVCNLTKALNLYSGTKFSVTNCKLYFKVDQGGILISKVRLDREKLYTDCTCNREIQDLPERGGVCRLQLELWDLESQLTHNVEVELTDLNDNAPRFERVSFSVELNENMPEGTQLVLPMAKDPDQGINGTITYSLQGPNASVFSLKQVDSPRENGVFLRTLQRFDRESGQGTSLYLILVARDGGHPPLSTSLSVEVRLRDLNDNPPVFSERDYHVSVREDKPPDSKIAQIIATDRDGGNSPVHISIPETVDAKIRQKFKVIANGEVRLLSPLDYDSKSEKQEWVIPLLATDSGVPQQSASASLTVRVLDINDHAPKIEVNHHVDTSRFTVLENQSANRFVALISVTDKDSGNNGKFDCSLDAGKSEQGFRLDSIPSGSSRTRKYKLVTTITFDRERGSRYSLYVVCHDQGQPRQIGRKQINVYIGDANDNGPRFAKEFLSANVRENQEAGTPVLTLHASDPDSPRYNKVRYSIPARFSHLFSVDAVTGLVSTVRKFDREANTSVTFIAVAADSEKPQMNSSVKITVSIDDVNDCRPKFDQDFVFSVEEGSTRFIGRVQATDCDIGNNARITYHLQSSSKNRRMWSVDRDGNIHITSNANLNREDTPSYTLQIVARDAGKPALSATATVQIIVVDRNDNNPVFHSPAMGRDSVNISQDTKVGTLVFKAFAEDADEGDNSRLRYYLTNQKRRPVYFSIDELNGEIRLNRTLPRTRRLMTLKLIISAHDYGAPRRTSVALLTINLVDSSAVGGSDIPGANEKRSARQHWSRTLVLGLGIGLILLILVCLLLLVTYFACSLRHNSAAERSRANTAVKYEAATHSKKGHGAKNRLSFMEFLRQSSTTSTQTFCCFKRSSAPTNMQSSLQNTDPENAHCNKDLSKYPSEKHDNLDSMALDRENSMLYTHVEEDGSSLAPYGQWTDPNTINDDTTSNHYWVYATTGPGKASAGIYRNNTYDPNQRPYTKLGPVAYNTYQSSIPLDQNNASESNSSEEIKRILRSVSVATPPYSLSANPDAALSCDDSQAGSAYQTSTTVVGRAAGRNHIRHAGYVAGSPCYTSSFV